MPKELIVDKNTIREFLAKSSATASSSLATSTEPLANKTNSNCKQQNKSQFKIIDFKESLRQRLKEKRVQQRREEEEEAKIDEEYHLKPDENSNSSGVNNIKTDEKKKTDKEISDEVSSNSNDACGDESSKQDGYENESDEESEQDDESNESESVSGDSDKDFKLNLNDDDEDEDQMKTTKKKHSDSGKTGNKATKKKEIYDFDSDDQELAELNESSNESKPNKFSFKNKPKNKQKGSCNEIPLTNTIPSNQLTKVI